MLCLCSRCRLRGTLAPNLFSSLLSRYVSLDERERREEIRRERREEIWRERREEIWRERREEIRRERREEIRRERREAPYLFSRRMRTLACVFLDTHKMRLRR